jgi:hypothetical protein
MHRLAGLLTTSWWLWGSVWGEVPPAIDWRGLGAFPDQPSCASALQQAQRETPTLEWNTTDVHGRETNKGSVPRRYQCLPQGRAPAGR